MNFTNENLKKFNLKRGEFFLFKVKIIFRILFSKSFFVVIRETKDGKMYNDVNSFNIPLKKVSDIAADIYIESISIEFDNVEGLNAVKK